MKKSMMAASTRMAMPQPGTPSSVTTVSAPCVGLWVTVFPGMTEELEADMVEILLLGCTVVVEDLEGDMVEMLLIGCTSGVEEVEAEMAEMLLLGCSVVFKGMEAEVVEMLLRCFVMLDRLEADTVAVMVLGCSVILLLFKLIFEVV